MSVIHEGAMSPKRSALFKAGRREAILDAAMRLFVTRGYDRTTMREIAAEAGVSTGAIYVYFQTKAAMLQSLCAEEAALKRAELLDAIRTAAPGDDPFAVGLGAAFRHYIESSATERREREQLQLLLQYEATRDPAFGATMREMIDSWRSVIIELAREERAAGRLRDDVDLAALATILIALPFGLASTDLLGDGKADWSTLVSTLSTILRRGVDPAPAPAATAPIAAIPAADDD
jgi:AcrR family transcriptional regulator